MKTMAFAFDFVADPMLFGDITRQNGNGHGRSHKYHSPMSSSFAMSDFLIPNTNNGFTSFSSISSMSSNGRPSGSGAVKRTSTSTTYVNGKKMMTKRYILRN